MRWFKSLPGLRIPQEKDKIFLYPELSGWRELLDTNMIHTKTLPGKSRTRSELLETARNYTRDICTLNYSPTTREPIIATGHQAVWHHCGIWVKDVITCQYARDIGGCAIHLVLDHDICDTSLLVPQQNESGYWSFERIDFEPEPVNIPLEFRRAPNRKYMESCLEKIVQISKNAPINIKGLKMADSMRRHPSELSNIADFITCIQSNINQALGIRLLYLPVSQLSQSDAFTEFVTGIIIEALEFAQIYNQSIDHVNGSRSQRKINALKQLIIDPAQKSAELPFWVVSPDGKRLPLYVLAKKNKTVYLYTESTELGFIDAAKEKNQASQLKDILQQSGLHLRPKAVSLTLFVRLFLADWFIHGIGGALYESVTDHLVSRYYQLNPLAFGVATATVRLPLPEQSNSVESMADLQQQLHRMKHNPEKYIKKSTRQDGHVAALITTKNTLLKQMNRANLPRCEKKSAWELLTQINTSLLKYAQDAEQEITKKMEIAENARRSKEVCGWREYFFGLFPEQMLQKLTSAQ